MEVHVERLLGRRVVDSTGRAVGRLQEIHTRRRGADVVVVEWVLGTGGLIERLSLGPLVRGLLGRWSAEASSYRLPWDALNLSEPEQPRLVGRLEDWRPGRRERKSGRRASA